jgi:putative ABC transport system permease protein
MSTLLRIALRNVFRNKWRSAISAAAIVVGVAVIVFLQGFANGFLGSVLSDAVDAKVGGVQVHRHGFLDAEQDPLKLDLPADNEVAATIRATPGVVAVTPRITFEGMLSNGNVSTMFSATAIDPRTEYTVCPKRRDNIAPGSQPLDEHADNGALLGKALVESLDAKSGTTLTMLSASQAGASNALDVSVKGFLPSKMIVESKRLATVPLAFAQDLLRMPGRATEFAVRVDDLERADEIAARIKARLGDGYDVQGWRDLAPMVRDAVIRLRIVLITVSIILFLLVLTGIINTMLMNVYERVREIGTMLAVGVHRRQIVALFLFEAAILGLLGALAGAAIGSSVVAWMGRRGLHMTPPGADPQIYYPVVDPSFVALAVAVAVAGALLAALYPSWKASRMRPVDALRAN